MITTDVDTRNAKVSAEDRAAFLAASPGDRRIEYISGDGQTLTTRTGEHLARITAFWSRPVGFGWRPQRWYFRAVDENGNRWHGNSPGTGMYARCTRSR